MQWFSFKFPFFQRSKRREFKFEHYSHNSEHTYENFAVNLEHDNFWNVPLGFAGGHEWTLLMKISQDMENVQTCFYCENDNPNLKHRTRGLFNLKNGKPSMEGKFLKHCLSTLPHDKIMGGPEIPILEILDPKKGWLDEYGALTLKYGLQVEAIQENGIWKFNFYDIFFGGDYWKLFTFEGTDGILYCNRLLLIFHSPRIRTHMWIPYPYGSEEFEKLLQRANGVRLQREDFDIETIEKILGLARYFKMRNVIRFLENQFIQDHSFLKFLDSSFKKTMEEIKLAIQYNTGHYLGCLLKTRHCSNRARFSYWILKNVNFEKTNHELMKMIVKKILY